MLLCGLGSGLWTVMVCGRYSGEKCDGLRCAVRIEAVDGSLHTGVVGVVGELQGEG